MFFEIVINHVLNVYFSLKVSILSNALENVYAQIAEGTASNLQAAFDSGMGDGNVPEIFDYFKKLQK